MAQPTVSQVHVNAPLTNISLAYIQNARNFIATQVFPIVPVSKQSDIFPVYTKNDWLRDEAKIRSAGTESAGGGYGIDTSNTYYCYEYSIHKDIPDNVRANPDDYINVDKEAALWVAQKLLIRMERQWAVNNFATSKWGKDYTGVAGVPVANQFKQWSDYAASDPVADISTGKMYILENTGLEPNVLVLGVEVFEKLKNHPDIVDRYKYTSAASITEDMLAQVFGVDKVLVGKATYATNEEGAASAAYDFINGKGALLCYVPQSPGLYTPSAGYTFVWKNLVPINNAGYAIETFRMQQLKSERVEGTYAADIKITGTDLGAFFATAIA